MGKIVRIFPLKSLMQKRCNLMHILVGIRLPENVYFSHQCNRIKIHSYKIQVKGDHTISFECKKVQERYPKMQGSYS